MSQWTIVQVMEDGREVPIPAEDAQAAARAVAQKGGVRLEAASGRGVTLEVSGIMAVIQALGQTEKYRGARLTAIEGEIH